MQHPLLRHPPGPGSRTESERPDEELDDVTYEARESVYACHTRLVRPFMVTWPSSASPIQCQVFEASGIGVRKDNDTRLSGRTTEPMTKGLEFESQVPQNMELGCLDGSQSRGGYADRNEWKNLFSAIKAVYSPPTKGTAALLGADGSALLAEKTQILQRWAEHFRGVLNSPSTISDAPIACLTQVEANVDLDLPPSPHETIRVVQQLSSGKAPGSDAIPARSTRAAVPNSWII
ncbi:hypothetical protein SprV_0200698300 [Sparganum proliferum]